MNASVLIVEDEVELGRAMAWALEQSGLQAEHVTTGSAALERLQGRAGTGRACPDLVLLDLMLPDMAGEDVARSVRQDPATARLPIVMVSAKDSEVDRVVGLALGADDYVAKPFSMRELILRVRAILRRTRPSDRAASTRSIGLLRLDHDARQAWVDGEPLDLTALEFRLLETFAGNPGQVLRREDLLDEVWGTDAGELTLRAVDARIKALRRKLGPVADELETVRGVGYRFGSRAA